MTFLETLKDRRAVRNYLPLEVETDKITKLFGIVTKDKQFYIALNVLPYNTDHF
jgi:hypothetical protein